VQGERGWLLTSPPIEEVDPYARDFGTLIPGLKGFTRNLVPDIIVRWRYIIGALGQCVREKSSSDTEWSGTGNCFYRHARYVYHCIPLHLNVQSVKKFLLWAAALSRFAGSATGTGRFFLGELVWEEGDNLK
jgi:hypothetical protein